MINLKDTSAFEAFKPLADRIEDTIMRQIVNIFAKWVEASGGVYKYYRYEDVSFEAQDFRVISKYIKPVSGEVLARGTEVKLDVERVAKIAKQIGEDSVLGFVAKLTDKVGDIKMTQLNFHGGADFSIHGHVNGHDIRIDQQTVYKMSTRWVHYCQFPARIYVDGKFTPASKFKEAVA
jgi:hypothetical protein